MMITDILTIICAIFLTWRGFNRGFLSSLAGPIGLILGSIVSFVYYLLTKNMLVSLCIGLFLPILLSWIFRSSLKTWNRFNNPDKKLSLLSRLSGVLLSLTWGMTILIITILLLAMTPPVNKPLKMLTKDIRLSKIYHILKPLDNSAKDNQLSAKDNIKTLSEDKRIQDIVNDPEITAAINRKDYAFLMSHPKITAIMQDPVLLKKMLSIYQSIGEEQAGKQ